MMARLPLIGATVALLIGVAYFFLLHQPRSVEQAELQQETDALASQQALLIADLERLRAVRDDQPRIAAEMARLESLIPGTVAQPSAIRQFQAIADAAGVGIRSVSFGDPLPVTPAVSVGTDRQLGMIPTTMVMDGGYFSAVDFLRRVEQDGDRAVLVQNLAIAEGEGGFPALSTTWTGNLFALIPLAPQPTGEAPGGVPGGAPGEFGTAEPAPDGSGVAPAPGQAPPASGQPEGVPAPESPTSEVDQ